MDRPKFHDHRDMLDSWRAEYTGPEDGQEDVDDQAPCPHCYRGPVMAIIGPDVSHYQGTVDRAAVAGAACGGQKLRSCA